MYLEFQINHMTKMLLYIETNKSRGVSAGHVILSSVLIGRELSRGLFLGHVISATVT